VPTDNIASNDPPASQIDRLRIGLCIMAVTPLGCFFVGARVAASVAWLVVVQRAGST
jgi:hypothetical protein